MLDSIEKDNNIISQMYKGNELVWEMPTVMTSGFDLYPGTKSISFTTYPSRCNVVVTINDKEVANDKSGINGAFFCSLDQPLKDDDYVVIKITKPGWMDRAMFF